MKHTKDPTQAEQERFFLETWERENAGLNGRHTEKVPGGRCKYATGSADPVPYPCGVEDCDHCRHTEKAPRKRYARRPGPPKYFRGILPTSGRGRLLDAARRLPRQFGETALVLMAWEHSPRLFGLKGAEGSYPSDRKVTCLLYGSKGLVARGLIVKCEGGLMRVASPPG